MKKQATLILVSTTLLVIAAFALIEGTVAQTDFNAYSGAAIDDGQIDGNIGSEWDDAGKTFGVALDPQGTADVWTKHDGTNLYIAVRFTADSNNPWIAMQFGGNSCMEGNTDTAIFGNDNYNVDGYKDCYMSSTGGAKPDATEDGKGAINVTSSNVVTVELKKSLQSGDEAGKDIDWKAGDEQTLIIIWDSNGRGSSDGQASHSGATFGNATVRTILINSESNPSPGPANPLRIDTTLMIIIVVVVVVAAIVVVVGVRWARKRGTKKMPDSTVASA